MHIEVISARHGTNTLYVLVESVNNSAHSIGQPPMRLILLVSHWQQWSAASSTHHARFTAMKTRLLRSFISAYGNEQPPCSLVLLHSRQWRTASVTHRVTTGDRSLLHSSSSVHDNDHSSCLTLTHFFGNYKNNRCPTFYL